ncbi:hypothetical protein L3Q82_017174 [Scortum barcoo]|uniref:Uncharacterized protein n=1 Tax=Scortum barcoo TaxID=214431 RepID=A0ACB8VL28_9TELE|nr:hypothetical protein L3Q82_017174 [Scortum barcoo]
MFPYFSQVELRKLKKETMESHKELLAALTFDPPSPLTYKDALSLPDGLDRVRGLVDAVHLPLGGDKLEHKCYFAGFSEMLDVVVLLLSPAGLPAVVQCFSHLSFNLCKWCEVSSPVCKDSTCLSNCTLSSFCTAIEEICIAIWPTDSPPPWPHRTPPRPEFLPPGPSGLQGGLLGLPVPVNCVRSPTCQHGPIGLLLQPDSIPYFRVHHRVRGCRLRQAPETFASTTLRTRRVDNGGREHGPLGLNVPSLPRNLRKTNDTMTVHTMCHNPTLPLEGVDPGLLLNITSRECHMTPQPAEDGAMMVCGCHGEHE